MRILALFLIACGIGCLWFLADDNTNYQYLGLTGYAAGWFTATFIPMWRGR